MKPIFFTIALISILILAFLFQYHARELLEWINTLGLLAPILFLMLYCASALFFLPTMILTLAGGALFGPVLGTIFNLAGATLGALSAFCVSRYVVSGWLTRLNNVRINRLIKGIDQRGWPFAALLRLVPIIPFHLVNYGLGITRITFTHYLLTTVIFLIPTEILFTYCGAMGMDLMLHFKHLGSP